MGKSGKKAPQLMEMRLHNGRLGKIQSCRRGIAEKGLKGLGFFKTLLGVLVFVLLAVGAYLAVTNYILPGTGKAEGAASELSSESSFGESSVEESREESISYDSKTGLPIYSNEDILLVVNNKSPLDEEYSPDLITVEGVLVHAKIRDALMALIQRAEKDGVTLTLESGYVSPQEQEENYNAKVQELIEKDKFTKIMAKAKAQAYVPKAGYSDLQTGFCVSLKAEEKGFEESETYIWLNKNAADFGFVFRYPKDKEDFTRQEPNLRVLRYVGSENATRMRQLSMCLEEYAGYLQAK